MFWSVCECVCVCCSQASSRCLSQMIKQADKLFMVSQCACVCACACARVCVCVCVCVCVWYERGTRVSCPANGHTLILTHPYHNVNRVFRVTQPLNDTYICWKTDMAYKPFWSGVHTTPTLPSTLNHLAATIIPTHNASPCEPCMYYI